jgi:hypothetical protein
LIDSPGPAHRHRYPDGPPMGDAVAEGVQSQPEPTTGSVVVAPKTPPAPHPLRIEKVFLLDLVGNDPTVIDAIVFDDDGIGIIRSPGGEPRVLPWPSVTAHVVERWGGGVIHEWWVDPERNRNDPSNGPAGVVTDPTATARVLPRTDPGAVISIQSPFGTYRFLVPAGDPDALSQKMTDFAVRHHGLSGVPPITTVARTRRGRDRRQGTRVANKPSGWPRVQPYLVVALIVVIATVVTLILLQSAGTIHLPLLGGSSPGVVVPLRTR